MTELRKAVETYWAAADARDWTAFAGTLAAEVVYDLPQTRERIRGKDAFLRFNVEYPGDWRVRTERVVADPDAGQVVTWLRVTVGGQEIHAVSFFTGDGDGRIAGITDFWPEPYEPPAGRGHLVERY